MSQENPQDLQNANTEELARESIAGALDLAQSLTQATQQGLLFFLAVEVELLLHQYLSKNGLPPTPIDLELILVEAARAMLGEPVE